MHICQHSLIYNIKQPPSNVFSYRLPSTFTYHYCFTLYTPGWIDQSLQYSVIVSVVNISNHVPTDHCSIAIGYLLKKLYSIVQWPVFQHFY